MAFSALYHTFVVFAIKAPFACILCPLLPSLGLNNTSLQNSYHGNKMVPSQYFSQKQYCVCWLRMGLWRGWGGGAITFLASGVREGQHPCVRTPVFACDLRAYMIPVPGSPTPPPPMVSPPPPLPPNPSPSLPQVQVPHGPLPAPKPSTVKDSRSL